MRKNHSNVSEGQTDGHSTNGAASRPRRALLAGAAGALGAAAAGTLASAAPARAQDGLPVLLGISNEAESATDVFSGDTSVRMADVATGIGLTGLGSNAPALSADTSVGVRGFGGLAGVTGSGGVGVVGNGGGADDGVQGNGGPGGGAGVVGTGGGANDGVQGSGGPGGGRGVVGNGEGAGHGVEGFGGSGGVGGVGLVGHGGVTNDGVVGFGGPNGGRGVTGEGSVTSEGVAGIGGPGPGHGATGGVGVSGVGGAGNHGVVGTGGAIDVTGFAGVGVVGHGGRNNDGVIGFGGPIDGRGVVGFGSGATELIPPPDQLGADGVVGFPGVGAFPAGVTGYGGRSGDGMHAFAGEFTTALVAKNTDGFTALEVDGVARFDRSGILTVPVGATSVTFGPVLLYTAASLVLATLQIFHPGLWVAAAVPDVQNHSITVYLNRATSSPIAVAYFIIN